MSNKPAYIKGRMKMIDIEERIVRAEIASCTCMTKTHEHEYHDDGCRYRVLEEARRTITALRAENKPIPQDGSVTCGDCHYMVNPKKTTSGIVWGTCKGGTPDCGGRWPTVRDGHTACGQFYPVRRD